MRQSAPSQNIPNPPSLNAIRGEIRLTPAGIVIRKGLQGLRGAHGNLHDPAVDEILQGAQEFGEVDAWRPLEISWIQPPLELDVVRSVFQIDMYIYMCICIYIIPHV